MDKDNKKFIVETNFLREILKHNLSLKEFLVLMYFDNESDSSFDVKKVSKMTSLSEDDVLKSFGLLLDKKLLVLNSVKDEKTSKLVEKVSLDNLYIGIKNDSIKKKKDKNKSDFFSKFQLNYKHSLGPMDYELINAWLAGFSDDLILEALKEANYNGKVSLSYIDSILFEWKKKGISSPEEVEKHLFKKSKDEEPKISASVLDYNWLDED